MEEAKQLKALRPRTLNGQINKPIVFEDDTTVDLDAKKHMKRWAKTDEMCPHNGHIAIEDENCFQLKQTLNDYLRGIDEYMYGQNTNNKTKKTKENDIMNDCVADDKENKKQSAKKCKKRRAKKHTSDKVRQCLGYTETKDEKPPKMRSHRVTYTPITSRTDDATLLYKRSCMLNNPNFGDWLDDRFPM
eukprot:571610_1